jgi:hypothetical protein
MESAIRWILAGAQFGKIVDSDWVTRTCFALLAGAVLRFAFICFLLIPKDA